MWSDRLPFPFVAGALLLALMSCADASLDAGPSGIVIEGRTSAEIADESPRVALRTGDDAARLLAETRADASGAFRLFVDDVAGGERVELHVSTGDETRAVYRFALDRPRLALPDAGASAEIATSTLIEDALEVQGWSSDPGLRVALLEDSWGRVRWEAVAEADGRARVPREVLAENGLHVSLARRTVIDADGAEVTVESRGVRLPLPLEKDEVPLTPAECLVDGAASSACANGVAFRRTIELGWDAPIAPASLLVRAYQGPAYVVERSIGDGVWEVVARVGSPSRWERVPLAADGPSSRFRLRLLESAPARSGGLTFHPAR